MGEGIGHNGTARLALEAVIADGGGRIQCFFNELALAGQDIASHDATGIDLAL